MSDTEYEPGISHSTEAVVLSTTRITPDNTDEVREIRLRLNASAIYYLNGETLGVLAPGPHPFGNKVHHRYYTITRAAPAGSGDGVELDLLVRRCFYIDEVSGEQYPGEASNHLCDARPGDVIRVTGPYHSPFKIPADDTSHLLMLGTGTGIAPFRAFLRQIYEERKGWKGEVRLYFGARTGREMLYMNDHNNDLALYYDQDTFKAIQALGGGVMADDGDALGRGVADHAAEIWQLLQSPKTHVFLAGMKKVAAAFDASMAPLAGSAERWAELRQRLMDERRWSELTYH